MTKKRSLRVLLIAIVVVALVATCFSLVACNKDKNKGNGGKNTASLRRPNDVYALAGVSTGAMLSNMNNGVSFAGEAVTDESVIEELNSYMALVDTLVSGNPSNNEVRTSDREGYATMQVMNVPSLDGTWTEYKLYYNDDSANAVAMSDDDDDDEDEEDEADEEEFESHITGIMVINGNEYPIKGDIEVEGDEQEIEFTAYTNEAKTSYIVFEQEMESNESEFEYEQYENGVFVSSFSLEIETENYVNEFELETENAAGEVIEYEIKKDSENGKIDVEFTKNGEKGKFTVEATQDENGNPIYKYFLEGKEIDKDRD